MFTKIWNKITSHRKTKPHQSYRSASKELGILKSTIHDHSQRLKKRNVKTEDEFLESEAGLSEQRLNVLTVVHNFDIRGIDNKTPAERLFQKEFPDMFEFILDNVTSFSQPRQRKRKPLKTLTVRA